jgi:hypothetical protein
MEAGFALNADGSAVDPAAFREALRADAARLREVQADPQLAAALLGGDDGELQALLRSVYEARAGD